MILSCFSVCVFLVSCSTATTYEFYNEFKDVNSAKLGIEIGDAENVTNLNMDKLFRTSYDWNKLKSHELFFDGKCIIFNVFFDLDVPYWQIKSVRDYIVIYLYNGHYNNISPTPYEDWRVGVKPEAVLVNIYIDDDLILQDYFDGKSELLYENTRVKYSCKSYESDLINKVKKDLEDISGCRVNYIRSMTRDGIILQFEHRNQINPENIPLILKASESLHEEFTRVVLEFYSNEMLYYDCFFYNGQWKNGKWTD